MVEPQEPPTFPKPHISDIGQAQQVFSVLPIFLQHTTCFLFYFISDFLSTVSVLLPRRVKLCIAPPPGRISFKLRLWSFNPHRQDWICLWRRGGGGCQGVADQLSSWELVLLLRMLFMSIGLLCVIAVLASLALWINNVWDVQIGELGIQENHTGPPWASVFFWPPFCVNLQGVLVIQR